MFAVIKNILSSENINWGILLSTSFFLLLGIIYFIRRYTNLELNQRQNVRNAAENSDFQHLQIEIHVQINLQRKTFVITPNEIIGAFINSKIKPLINNQNAHLIFQGQILDSTKPFSHYQNRITQGSVLLCQIIEGQSHYDEMHSGNEENNMNYNDEKSVSAFALLMHLMIFLLTLFLIFCYNSYREIFDKVTIRLIQFMLVNWVVFFSDSISKLILYRKIVY